MYLYTLWQRKQQVRKSNMSCEWVYPEKATESRQFLKFNSTDNELPPNVRKLASEPLKNKLLDALRLIGLCMPHFKCLSFLF